MSFLWAFSENFVTNLDARVLDLVLCDVECSVIHSEEILTSEDVHHPALEITVKNVKNKLAHIRTRNGGEFNFKKADFPSLYRNIVETDFSFLNSITDVNRAVELLYDKLYKIFNFFVPKKRQPTRIYSEWFNKEIIVNLKQKH